MPYHTSRVPEFDEVKKVGAVGWLQLQQILLVLTYLSQYTHWLLYLLAEHRLVPFGLIVSGEEMKILGAVGMEKK